MEKNICKVFGFSRVVFWICSLEKLGIIYFDL